MRILLLCSIVILAGCTPVKKSDYTSVTYYEKHDRWLFPDKYTELVVAIPVDDRVPPAFCVTRHLFAKEGDAYKEISVVTVNTDAYEASEKRRLQLITNIYNFFRLLALLGIVSAVLGLILFVVSKKFPVLPDIWDELLLYGAVVAAIGVTGAWYAEELIKAGIVACTGIGIAAIYSAWRRHLKQSTIRKQDVALTELVDTVETYKEHARDVWEDVQKNIGHSTITRDIVAQKKPAIKARRVVVKVPVLEDDKDTSLKLKP